MENVLDRKKELIKQALTNEITRLEEVAKPIAEEMVFFAMCGYDIKNGKKEILAKLNITHMEQEEASAYCYKKKDELEKKHEELIMDMQLLRVALWDY